MRKLGSTCLHIIICRSRIINHLLHGRLDDHRPAHQHDDDDAFEVDHNNHHQGGDNHHAGQIDDDDDGPHHDATVLEDG